MVRLLWTYATTKAPLASVPLSVNLTHVGAAVVAEMIANTITKPVWLLSKRVQLQKGALSAAPAGGGWARRGGGRRKGEGGADVAVSSRWCRWGGEATAAGGGWPTRLWC